MLIRLRRQKRDILRTEARTGHKDVPARRAFNAALRALAGGGGGPTMDLMRQMVETHNHLHHYYIHYHKNHLEKPIVALACL